MKRVLLAAGALCLAGLPALADGEGVLTYELFETAIGHVNLSECPGDLAGEGRFCRMTMHNDAFHVFAFTEEGEQPLVGIRTWYEDEIDLAFK